MENAQKPLAAVLLAAFLLIFPGGCSRPKVTEEALADARITINYYDIHGNSPAEVWRAIVNNGPVDQFGQRCSAYTKWKISWHWRYRADGSADYRKTAVSYRIWVTLPRLVSSSNDPALMQWWQELWDGINRHEAEHVRLVRVNHSKVRTAILEAARGKPGLSEEEAHAAAEKAVAVIRQLDLRYDRETKRGRTEGIDLDNA